MKSVLLTNGLLRKTLAAARSLGVRGIPVHVAETTRLNPASFSRHAAKTHVHPAPAANPQAFVRWLADTVEKERIGVLFPMDDDTMGAVQDARDVFQADLLSALPPAESYRIAADKGETVRLAHRAGVPVPKTAFPADPDEAVEMAREFDGPIVVKPRQSSGSRGIRVVERRDELAGVYRKIHELYPRPLLQSFVPAGDRYDVCLLYDRDGALKASFVQKELRHYPLERGPSTMQESVHRPDLVDLAARLIGNLPWTGVVEAEFMVDPRDGTPVLMEINPRFWNSLQAAILSGIDFPWLLYRIATGGHVELVHDYRTGVRCRSLLPGDMLHYLANPDRFRLEPGFWRRPPEGGTDDILSWRDPGPAFGVALAACRLAIDPDRWKQFFIR